MMPKRRGMRKDICTTFGTLSGFGLFKRPGPKSLLSLNKYLNKCKYK